MTRSRLTLVTTIALSLALSLIAPTPALCEDEDHRGVGIGAFAGYSKATDAEEGAFLLGADLSLRMLGNLLGIRLEGAYRNDTYEGGNVATIPLLASVQILPLRNFIVSPFAIAGLGAWCRKYDNFRVTEGEGGQPSTIDGVDWDFGWHIGGGLDLNLTSWLTVTGDIRWVFENTDLENIPDSSASGIWVTAGLNLFI